MITAEDRDARVFTNKLLRMDFGDIYGEGGISLKIMQAVDINATWHIVKREQVLLIGTFIHELLVHYRESKWNKTDYYAFIERNAPTLFKRLSDTLEPRRVDIKEFEVIDALPVEGKDGVLDIFVHVLDVKGRDGILFNTYLVCSFDEKAYNTAVEDARSKGISTETVSKTDFRNEKYVAIEKNRDALVSFARSGRPFLFVDEEQIVDYEEFREEMKFCKKYLNFDIAEHIDSNIHELGKQELFNRYREAFKDFSGVDIVQSLHIFDGEEYWQELSEERRDAFYDAWQQSKHLFYDKQDIEQEMER
jgi:hypothetical protein